MDRRALKLEVSKAAVRGLAVAAVYFALAAPQRAGADVIANYTFSGNSLASSDTSPSSTASNIAAGAGLSPFAMFFNPNVNAPAYGMTSDHTPSTEALSITGNDYFSFTITPSSGSLAYSALNYNININNSSQSPITESVSVRWSVDGFASSLGTNSSSVNAFQNGTSGAGVTLSSFPAQSGPVEFRFYFFDNLDDSNATVGIDSISLTATAVPEPSSLIFIVLGGAGAFMARRLSGLGIKR